MLKTSAILLFAGAASTAALPLSLALAASGIAALALDLDDLTLYAFSKENWSRPLEEVSALMNLLCEFVERERRELAERAVRVDVLGDLSRLSPEARRAVRSIEDTTAAGGRPAAARCRRRD